MKLDDMPLTMIQPSPELAPRLPYAPGIAIPPGVEFVFLSGAIQSEDESAIPVGIREQTRLVMERQLNALASVGLSWSDVVHVFEYIVDMRESGEIHKTMAEYIPDSSWKTSNTLLSVQGLARTGARFELDIVAVRKPDEPRASNFGPSEVSNGKPTAQPVSRGILSRDQKMFWFSGATGLPLYHHHPHIKSECSLPDDIEEQASRALTTISDLLAFSGLEWGNVFKISQFYTDLRDHDSVQSVIGKFLENSGAQPVSNVIGVKSLSSEGARVEIEVMASSAIGATREK